MNFKQLRTRIWSRKARQERLGYFCLCLFLMCFFFICPQSHISHYYVRSVFPHCNGSKLHKSPNPARPPHLTEICHVMINETFKTIIDAASAQDTHSITVLSFLVKWSDSQSGVNKVQFSGCHIVCCKLKTGAKAKAFKRDLLFSNFRRFIM